MLSRIRIDTLHSTLFIRKKETPISILINFFSMRNFYNIISINSQIKRGRYRLTTEFGLFTKTRLKFPSLNHKFADFLSSAIIHLDANSAVLENQQIIAQSKNFKQALNVLVNKKIIFSLNQKSLRWF